MKSELWLSIMGLIVLSGCLTAPSHGDGPEIVADEAPAPLDLSAPIAVTGILAREPAIEQTPDGALFVAGYRSGLRDPRIPFLHDPPPLWTSVDAGATWKWVDVGTVAEGAVGNSDVDLAVAPNGDLYYAAMSYSRVGQSIAVGASHDDGVTWTWSVLSAQPGVDRPWVEVAPDGTVHVVWNDGVQVHHASSEDRGATWVEGPIVHPRGGTGMLAVSPTGDLAVRIIPGGGAGYTNWEGSDGVAVSTDGGASWRFQEVPGERVYESLVDLFTGNEGDGTPRWADPLVFDTAGVLYTAWSEDESTFLARSVDLGETWNVTGLPRSDHVYPYYQHLRAGPDAATLAMSWFEWEDGVVRAQVAIITDAGSDEPVMRNVTYALPTGTGGEYFQVTFLQDGGIGFANTIEGDEKGFAYRSAR